MQISAPPYPDTPMMKQYYEIKGQYPDAILFFRMGDFYEMFYEDARIAADVLQIALTERQKGVPMAGVPYHAAEPYLNKFVQNGFKVAICEQLETKPDKGQKIVRREVARIVTPGTHFQDDTLSSFLISIYWDNQYAAAVVCDFSSGESFLLYQSTKGKKDRLISFVQDIFSQYSKSEYILPEKKHSQDLKLILTNLGVLVNTMEGWVYDASYTQRTILDFFHILTIDNLWQLEKSAHPVAAASLGSFVHYVQQTQKQSLTHIRLPRIVQQNSFLQMNESALRSLELVENQQDGSSRHTLFHVLDHCCSYMGKRRLKQSLLHPLMDISLIEKRLQTVDFFIAQESLRMDLREHLSNMRDLEKIYSKLSMNRALPADLGNLRDTLARSLTIIEMLSLDTLAKYNAMYIKEWIPAKSDTTDLQDLYQALETQIVSNPPLNFDGDIIASGHNERVDHLRQISRGGKDWIAQYQLQERERLGIHNLKVKYNKVFGYFIEISKGQIQAAPKDYERKQTLVNAERFTTEKLKEFERDILSADDELFQLEKKIFAEIVANVLVHARSIQSLADFLGLLDMYLSFADRASRYNYCRPQLIPEPFIDIAGGRHPVVEHFLESGQFVPNDLQMDSGEKNIGIITGPNMAGKSTFIRQVALICIMAQMGSYVPADHAVLGICDKIFTRIGASDNLARGQSTFLLEMQETAVILNNYTRQSLLILDEVGRGTSTYDGMSIAWSLLEYLSRNKLMPRTLFATHYHELTAMAQKNGIFNLTLLVEELDNKITFLRQVVPGAADRSYGIHVAQLAGIPFALIKRAYQILQRLEEGNEQKDKNQLSLFAVAQNEIMVNTNETINETMDVNTFPAQTNDFQQPAIKTSNTWLENFDPTSEILSELENISLDEITPLQALQMIGKWQIQLRDSQSNETTN